MHTLHVCYIRTRVWRSYGLWNFKLAIEKVTMLRLGFRLSFGLRCHVLCDRWVQRNSAKRIFCLEQRGYSSSTPVRGTGRCMFLDLKERSQYRRHRVVSCEEPSQELEVGNDDTGLRGNELMRQHEEVYDEVRLDTEKGGSKQGNTAELAHKTIQDVENTAIQYLASRAYSAAELKKKLIGKRFSPEIIDGVITDFASRGLINDSLYAESFSQSRWSSSTWGPRRIKQALFKKGVSNSNADMAIKLVFEDGEEDEELKHGLSRRAMDQLYVQASKQWLRGRDAPLETRKARLVRWLQYRGFSWPVIASVLKKFESDGDNFL